MVLHITAERGYMKGIKKLLNVVLTLVLIFEFFGVSKVDVNAMEETTKNDIWGLEEADWLTEESKATILKLCEDSDSIKVFIPNNNITLYNTDDMNNDEAAYIMASKTVEIVEIEGITYVEKEETLIALSSISGSYSASGQKYGVAASNVVDITWSYSDPALSDLKIKFNSMTAKYTNLPTVSSDVTKIEYSASLQPPFGSYTYLATNTISNPSEGIPYTKTLNSEAYLLGGDAGFAMITVYYANGDTATYEGTLSKKF